MYLDLQIEKTTINGLLVVKPKVHGDHRGFFMESYRADALREHGVVSHFVQDNQSLSKKDILRGLHFQKPPFEQGKLVQVIRGAVLDVVVDIRSSSPTYGKSFSIELSEQNKYQLWIPPGFAHGFLTLEDDTLFCYKCTNYYNQESEGSVRWNSPELDIDWGIANPVLSEKDKEATLFSEFESPF